jgi:hypothetical protein
MSQTKYSYDNAYVAVITAGCGAAFRLGKAEKGKCLFLGVVSGDTGYDIKENEKKNDSTGSERLMSHKLEVSLEVLAKHPTLDLISGQKCAIVLIPSDQAEIPDDALNLGADGVTINADLTDATISAPVVLDISKPRKLGGGKVNAYKITGTQTGAKDDLEKSFAFLTTSTVTATKTTSGTTGS